MCSLTFWPRALASVSERMCSLRLHTALLYSWRRRHTRDAMYCYVIRPVLPVSPCSAYPMLSSPRFGCALLLRNISPETHTIFSWYIQRPKKTTEKQKRATACCHTSTTNPRPIFLHPDVNMSGAFPFPLLQLRPCQKVTRFLGYVLLLCVYICIYVCVCIIVMLLDLYLCPFMECWSFLQRPI